VAETAFIGRKSPAPGEPTEYFALEGSSATPKPARQFVDLQFPERVGIETFVREGFVSKKTSARVQDIGAKHHRAEFEGEYVEVLRGGGC
jgi:hypothetical protein